MKTQFFASIICASMLTACSSNRTIPEEPTTDTTTSSSPLPKTATAFAPERDGTSFERAIIINEKTESTGIQAENTQLTTLYPGSKKISQRYEDYKGKQHEIVNVSTQDGREIAVYFDVSSYFGKQ